MCPIEFNNDSSDDLIRNFSFEFSIKYTHNFEKITNRLLSVAFNTKQRMFILLDALGLVTWEWRKTTNQTTRVLKYPDFEYRHIVNITYCKNHNCYFAIKGDSTLIMLNREFEEICTVGEQMRSILCMIYNTVNDELITCDLEGVKVWCLKTTEQSNVSQIKHLSNYKLQLKKKLCLANDWIRRIEIDVTNYHMYCCTSHDLYIYDFNGNLLRKFKKLHELSISCCVYSPLARYLLTGSEDSSIKIWSLNGGLIDYFRGHSKTITNLILNPHNSNLVISSSLDGSLKMWSLDVMQLIYELNLFEDGILWMGLTEDQLLYAACPTKISLMSIANFVDFWAISRNKILEIKSLEFSDREPRLIVRGEDTTIRIYRRSTTKSLTSVLPIPKVNQQSEIKCFAYTRSLNVIYSFIEKSQDLWLFYTKTCPATHIEVWHTKEVQEIKFDSEKSKNSLLSHNLTHKALDYRLLGSDLTQKITSICILEGIKVNYYDDQGPCENDRDCFLLLGRQNGTILFCDPILKGKKYFLFSCDKDPIVKISHDRHHNCLVTKIEQDKYFCVKYWSLPELEMKKEFYSSKNMTCFARIDEDVLAGYADGTLDLIKLSDEHKSALFLPDNFESSSNKSLRYEHKESINVVDASHVNKIYLTCSKDGCIKLWSSLKHLLSEINLDGTLSYACFLNRNSDIIIGWRNHLFIIYANRVLPHLEFDTDNDESFQDDSTIVDEISDDDEADAQIKEIDLESYLYPHAININTNGGISNVIEVPIKVEELEVHATEVDYEEDKSKVSTVPSSLYSTPRKSLTLFLPSVDLTLNAQINQTEIRSYLVELFSKSFQITNEAKYPKFGVSPSSTPTYTPRSSQIELEPQKQDENKLIEQFTQVSLARLIDLESSHVKKPNIKLEVNDDNLKARLPKSYIQSKMNQIRIDSKALIQSAPPRASMSAAKKNTKKKMNPVEIEPKRYPRKIIKRIANEKDREKQLTDSISMRKTSLYSDTQNVSVTKINIGSNKLVNANRSVHHNLIKGNLSSTKHHSQLIRDTQPQNTLNSSVNQISVIKKDFEPQKFTPEYELTGGGKEVSGTKTADEFDRNIQSIEPPDDVDNESLEASNQSIIYEELAKARYDQMNRAGTQSTSSQMLHSALLLEPDSKLNNFWDPTEGVLAVKKRATRELKPKILSYSEQELKKISNLFDYYYGESCRELFKNEKAENTLHDLTHMSKEFLSKKEKLEESHNQVKKNMDSWFERYERKSEQLNYRIQSAHERHLKINQEKTRKRLQLIGEKNNLTRDKQASKPIKSSIRLVKSAAVANAEKYQNRRPKSVTFLNVNEVKEPVIKLQEPYHISQIEIEEIIREAASRNSLKSQSVSSYTMIPDVYLKKFRSFSRASPKQELFNESDSEYFAKIEEFDEASLFKSDSMNTGLSKSTSKKESKVRIKSCTIDCKTPTKFATQKNAARVESASSYRLSLKDFRQSSSNSSKKEQETLLDPSNDLVSTSEIFYPSRIVRNRSPQSIPSRCTRYRILSVPDIQFEYKIPGFPERYLLPIRFPHLSNRILSSIARLKSAKARARREEEKRL